MNKLKMISSGVACGVILSISAVKAEGTFQTALTAYTKAHSQAVEFLAQSGIYGFAITTMNGEEGPMEIYKLDSSCSCRKIAASGGCVVSDASYLESTFGIDSTDAKVLSSKIQAYNESIK